MHKCVSATLLDSSFPSSFITLDEVRVKRESVVEEPHPAHILSLQRLINNLYTEPY